MKQKYFLQIALIFFLYLNLNKASAQSVIITTIVDGTVATNACTGGSGSDPRFVELYVSGTIDFTGYDLDVSINGASWVSKDISSLGSITSKFVYLVQNTDLLAFDAAFPSVTRIAISLGTTNGNDAVRVENSSAIVLDIFGNPSEIISSSTYTGWNYQDSYAKRKNGKLPNGGTFIESDFTYPGEDALAGLTCVTLATAVNLGSYIAWQGDDGTSPTDWSVAENWSNGSVPLATDNITIPNVAMKPIIGSGTNAVAKDITIDASSSITINGGGSLIADGNLTNNGTLTTSSDAMTSGTLIVKGTSTGNVTYQRYVTTNWHLVTSPVVGQDIDAFVTASSLTTSATNTNRKGLGTYNNVTPAWEYYATDAPVASPFNSGDGYTLKTTAAGTVNFTGTLKTNDLTSYSITEGNDGWNLVGNPYPSYMDVNAFLTANLMNFDASFANVYVWNGTAYAPISGTNYMAPGQGFFIKSKAGGATINITETMQSHQSATFYRNANIEVNLSITDESNSVKSTKIKYLEGKTTRLDPMFDAGMFTATNTDFAVYSHLISDSKGIDFEIQSLPNSDFENMIIPIGINAEEGKQITFTAEALNLPHGIKVFLEDKETNTFTRLDENNTEYAITVSTALNGIGRFYVHTTSQVLAIDNLELDTISVYTLDTSTLRIAGLQNGKFTLSIFNILGKQIIKESFTANGIKDITLPKVATGVYLVKLQTETGNLNKKIILE